MNFILYIIIIIDTHGHFTIAFLPLTTRLSMELFEAVFIENPMNKVFLHANSKHRTESF